MGYGLLVKITHTGKSGDSVHVSDIRDGVDVLGGAFGFRKAGPVYIPHPSKGGGGVALLVYAGDVAVSYETGGIRQFIQGGYLLGEFVAGSDFTVLLPAIYDEGVLRTPTPSSINFVGAGVTATNVGNAVTVTIPGGGAGSDHATLTNLGWLVSAHTGALNSLAGFDGAGATTTISKTVSGDVSGTFPGPLTVTDLTMAGEVQGNVLYFNGTNWVVLPPGTSGQVLQTQGAAANPIWATSGGGTTDHALLSNLGWTVSGHTGTAGSLATFNGAGAASVVTGSAHGDVLYFNGTVWSRLAPGTSGQVLQTNGSGFAPTWVAQTGGTTNHAALTNLAWTLSGHTGTLNTLAAFNGAGAAVHISTTVSGDVSGTLPGPLTVTDLTITGEVQGSTLYFNGSNWVQLPPGTSGQVLTTNGGGANPAWATSPSGVTSHSALTAPSLVWTASAHTGTANRFAVFDGGGAAAYMTTTAGGDLSGTYPNPTVIDLTISGEVQGSVLYFNGSNWVQLSPGTSGQVLQTQGGGANPIWATSGGGTTDHALLTNLGWTVSAHTGTAGSLATFNGVGAASVVTGAAHGDVLYFNGTVWARLAPGSAGQFLETQGVGAAPVWANPTSFSWKEPVDVKGYLGTRTVAEINALTPTIGQSVVAGSPGTPTAGTSDLLAVGDVAEFDGTSWKKLIGSVGGFPPAGTRLLVEVDPITLYSPLIDGTDEGKFAEFDGTSLTPASLVAPVDGDATLVKGEASVNENKQYVYDGSVPSGVWVQFGGSGLSHAALTALGWLVSGHTGTAGSLATFNGSGASSFVTGVSHGDILYFNGTTWVRLPPGTVDGNPLTTQTAGAPPTWDTAIAVDTITESTASNGVVVNTVRNYGKSATNPVAPAPTDGDIYYNTALRMQMTYDGLRSKWLSTESCEFHFGRDGATASGQYYRAADGRVMSSTLGWFAVRSGTVVSLGYTRTDSDAATFDIVANGSSIATVASSATGGRDIALNADFTFNQVLAALNQAGGNTTSDVIAYLRVKWRV